MVKGPVPAIANLIKSGPTPALASKIACRKLSAPLSKLLITIKVALGAEISPSNVCAEMRLD
jgi:hypothetical protein